MLFLSTPSARRATLTLVLSMTVSMIFLSTPSARRATLFHTKISDKTVHFYPRPPRGGRLAALGNALLGIDFYPRPPRGGRPGRDTGTPPTFYFYPRPPRGGRLTVKGKLLVSGQFLSTPSARRATAKTETKSLFSNKLYNILHEFRRALIYNGSKSYPNHAK